METKSWEENHTKEFKKRKEKKKDKKEKPILKILLIVVAISEMRLKMVGRSYWNLRFKKKKKNYNCILFSKFKIKH